MFIKSDSNGNLLYSQSLSINIAVICGFLLCVMTVFVVMLCGGSQKDENPGKQPVPKSNKSTKDKTTSSKLTENPTSEKKSKCDS